MKSTVSSKRRLRFVDYLLFFCCGILLNSSSLAQNNYKIREIINKADSLIKIDNFKQANTYYEEALLLSINKGYHDTIPLLYKKIATLLRKTENYAKAEIYYKKSIAEDSTTLTAAYCYYSLAILKRKEHNKDSSAYYLGKSLNIYDGHNHKEALNVFLSAGIIFKTKQQYNKALKYLLKAYDGFSKMKNLEKLARTSNEIAQIQTDIGSSKKAFYYYFKALSYRKQLKDTSEILLSYNNIANAHKAEKAYDSSLIYYQSSSKLSKENSSQRASILYNIGTIHYLKSNLSLAKEYYKKALAINIKTNNSRSTVFNCNELALIHLETNDVSKAKYYLSVANDLISKVESSELVARNLEINALLNVRLKKYLKAYDYQKQYTDLYKTIFNEKRAEIVQTLQEKFENEKALNENLKLSLKNKQNNLLIEEQKTKIRINRLLLVVSFLIIVLLSTAFLYIKQRNRIIKQEQSINYLKAVFKGQEEIKRHISKNLHDVITTNLDGIRLKIEALALQEDKYEKSSINDITKDIKNINHQMRLISHRLSPLHDRIKYNKLSEIIINQLSEFQSYRKIIVSVENDIPDVINNLRLDSQTNLYGILLEALNNIEKHAKASKIRISFQTEEKQNNLHVEIEDNGIGLEDNSVGVGIINMKHRTKLLKGNCSLSKTKEGTVFNLDFPINQNLK
ncbi:MAG: tetratricopeptide repeat protein [Bacteroidota bacterium]